MKANSNKTYCVPPALGRLLFAIAITGTLSAPVVHAQTEPADSKVSDAKSDAKAADTKVTEQKPAYSGPRVEIYKTFYLTNVSQQADANDIQTALRNLLGRAHLYYVPTQAALVFRGTAEEIALAQQVITDLDRTKKIYRLTYTITETDQGKRIGVQHFSIIVASGSKTDLKQGSKVPVSTGSSADKNLQITYIDVGLDIEADLDGYFDGVRLRTKVLESSMAEDKSGELQGDPVIRQTSLEGTSTLSQGKPLVLGSLDIPGSTRHQELEVVSEVVR